MPFEEGKSGNPDGRPKGSKNKVSNVTKEALLSVLEQVNPVELLHTWAMDRPELFKDIWKQLLPKAIELSGEGGEPIKTTYVVQPVRPADPKEDDADPDNTD